MQRRDVMSTENCQTQLGKENFFKQLKILSSFQ